MRSAGKGTPGNLCDFKVVPEKLGGIEIERLEVFLLGAPKDCPECSFLERGTAIRNPRLL